MNVLMGKIKIQLLSRRSIQITAILASLCVIMSFVGIEKYMLLQEATQDYIACEEAARKLQQGSDTLTKQVRLATATGEQKYIDAYFEEANVTRSRETAIDEFTDLNGSSDAINKLNQAMIVSDDLMQTEYYAIRLVEESSHMPTSRWPKEILVTKLLPEDEKLSDVGKMDKAQHMVTGVNYENTKDEISEKIMSALNTLIDESMERQQQEFGNLSKLMIFIGTCGILFVVMVLLYCTVMSYGIVKPLLFYNKSIKEGLISPVQGVMELQALAENYNKIYKEKSEKEMVMKYQAEHDPLTDLLNRRSFTHILEFLEDKESKFSLIIADVDFFKEVNDTYGNEKGDQILQNVAALLKKSFRPTDYVCRIGGDEFAVIMIDTPSDAKPVIEKKIHEINSNLMLTKGDLPQVSISAGVAFFEQKDRNGDLFSKADKALYYIKENGRCGCAFYPLTDKE